jgi:hypothetical protein
MDCRTVRELLSEYIDNELDLKLHSEVKEHLDSCPHCKEEYEDILLVKKALRVYSVAESEPSPEFSEKLCGMFKGTYVSCDENKAKSESRLIFCLICLAICAIIALSNGDFSLNRHKEKEQYDYYIIQSEENVPYPGPNRIMWRYIIKGNNK